MEHEDFEYTQLDDEEMTAFLLRQKQPSERGEQEKRELFAKQRSFSI
ncbi:hypothetical protein [Pedobacter mucosus]|nr:hypothetical protein [Pedobacter mucosus]UKT64298.1 hypothetical protein LOK61_00640 [Pedobacter mucosus]